MGSSEARVTRWVVCAGAGQYLDIAGRLVASGCAKAIEWDTVPARVLARLSQLPEGSVGVVMGEGCEGQPPLDRASSAAHARGSALTVLCSRDAPSIEEAAREHGVDACVTPEGLLALLAGIHADWLDGKRSDARPSGVGVSTGDAVPSVRPAGKPTRCHTVTQPLLEADGLLGELDLDLDEPSGCACPATPTPSEAALAGACAARRYASRGKMPHVPSALPGEDLGTSRENASEASASVGDESASHAAVPACERTPRLEVDVPDNAVPTICLASARGGVGKSTLAVMMALSMAHDGLRVALVDLDYQFGTCLGFLGLDETDGLPEPHGDAPLRLDARMLERCRSQGEGGLLAYEFCRLPERSELLVPLSEHLVRAARQGCDVAIVDLPAGMSEGVAQVLELSDRCLIVGDQQALSLESMAAAVALSTRLGVPRTKLLAVLNRCDARHRDEGFVSRARFELQTPQITRVVDGGPEVTRMLELGCASELLTMRNRCALTSADLASALCSDLGCTSGAIEPAPAAPPLLQPAPIAIPRRPTRRGAVREEMVPCLS